MVEVRQRDDEGDVVLRHECGEGGDVTRVVDTRRKGVLVRVVEGRGERIDVDGERARARAAERRDDVDALPRAGEEDADVAHGA